MARTDQVVGALAIGAGRSLDIQFPGTAESESATVSVTPTTRTAPSLQMVSNTANNWTQGGNGSIAFVSYKNVVAVRLRSASLGAGRYLVNGGIWGIRPRMGVSSIPQYRDPFAAYRLSCVMAFSAVPSTIADYGLEVTAPAGNPSGEFVFQGPVNGAAVIRDPSGDVVLAVRTQGSFLPAIYPIQPPGAFDATEFHQYELRFVSATAASLATMTILVDGIQTLQLPFDDVALPVYQTTYPQLRTSLNNSADSGADLYVAQLTLQASENIFGCL